MATARPLIGFVSLFLLAGGVLLQFLVILSGTTQRNPENQIYFIQASTNGIPGARNPSRWTFFSICGVDDNGRNTDCGATVPALPFSPPNRHDFGTNVGVPPQFIGTHHYYYLSRFMFALYLIALFFSVISLFTGLLALCSRLGGYLSGLNVAIAFFFQAITASLMTACFVQGRDAFRSAGQQASLGVKAFAFTWTSTFIFLLCTVLFCMGGSVSKTSSSSYRRRRGLFGRKASTRSRGSFIDTESQRRVKDEYE
ncbi:MAG: hypothetical protein M1820_003707 [Bogoriella megaspora]|nr:MAG: hypothetical protein M1820_003707 [Bogoriella megaspora]